LGIVGFKKTNPTYMLETIKGDLFISKPAYEIIDIEKNETLNKSLNLTDIPLRSISAG